MLLNNISARMTSSCMRPIVSRDTLLLWFQTYFSKALSITNEISFSHRYRYPETWAARLQPIYKIDTARKVLCFCLLVLLLSTLNCDGVPPEELLLSQPASSLSAAGAAGLPRRTDDGIDAEL